MTSWHDLPFEVKALILEAYIILHVKANAKQCLVYSANSIKHKTRKYKWWSPVKTFLLLVPALYDEALVILQQLKLRTEGEVAALLKDPRLGLQVYGMPWFLAVSRRYNASTEVALIADLYEELVDEEFRADIEWCMTKQGQKLVDEICEVVSTQLLHRADLPPTAERRGSTHAQPNNLATFVVNKRAQRSRDAEGKIGWTSDMETCLDATHGESQKVRKKANRADDDGKAKGNGTKRPSQGFTSACVVS